MDTTLIKNMIEMEPTSLASIQMGLKLLAPGMVIVMQSEMQTVI